MDKTIPPPTLEETASFQNLLYAHKKAAIGCRKSAEVMRFYFYLEKELIQLKNTLQSQTYTPSPHRQFTIFDPKERSIAVSPFKDRVVHHAVVNVLEPVFEKRFIFDSYASRRGKGTHKAITRAQTFLRRRPWYVKADIRHYFENIHHKTLLDMLSKRVDDTGLMKLIDKIITANSEGSRGLPIGNLTSQFFANLYLDTLDHYIKDGLGAACYLRYMDDFVIFGWSREQVDKYMTKAEQFCRERLGLSIKKRVLHRGKSTHGLTFLGMGIYPGTIRVRSTNRRRSFHRLHHKHAAWKKGKIDGAVMAASMESIMAHLNHFSNTRISGINN